MRSKDWRVIRLTQTIKNPNVDRRYKNEWQFEAELKEGLLLFVRPMWDAKGKDEIVPLKHKWTHQVVPTWTNLGEAILAASEPVDTSTLDLDGLLGLANHVHGSGPYAVLLAMCGENPILIDGMMACVGRVAAKEQAEFEAQQAAEKAELEAKKAGKPEPEPDLQNKLDTVLQAHKEAVLADVDAANCGTDRDYRKANEAEVAAREKYDEFLNGLAQQ